MKPEVVRVEDLEIFKTVAKVLGESQAKIELFKVLNFCDANFCDCEDISCCFTWSSTPQGLDFWIDIRDRLK